MLCLCQDTPPGCVDQALLWPELRNMRAVGGHASQASAWPWHVFSKALFHCKSAHSADFTHLSPLWWRLAKWKRCLAAWQVHGVICGTVSLDVLSKQRHYSKKLLKKSWFVYVCFVQAAWKYQNKQGTPTFCLYLVVFDISHVNGTHVSQPSCKDILARGEHIEWTTMQNHYGSTLVSSPRRPWTRLGFSCVLMIAILPSLLRREAGSPSF